MELLCWLRASPMFRAFFTPVAHLPLDHAGIDSVAAIREDFLRDLRQQVLIPALQSLATLGTLRQATAQYLQRPCERQASWRQVVPSRRLAHQYPHHVMGQQQTVYFLNYAS